MRRRSFLEFAGAAAFARMAAGCDRLVVIDPRLDPELPSITPIGEFYVYQYRRQPEFEPATHETVIAHEDEELARFDQAFLDTLEPVETELTLECIGATPRVQRISNAVWGGLPLREVLDELGVSVPPSAVDLRMTGMDDYHAAVPVTDLDDAPMWLFWRMNGEALPFNHGAPARIFVPDKYGVKAMKWIRELAFVDEPHVSYWTERNWSEEARVRPNTLVAHPLDGFLVDGTAPVRVIGTAFAGEDPVVAVDVRIDGGDWQPATVDYGPGSGIWVLWSFDWTPVEGRHTLQFRATTKSGAMSVFDPSGTNRLDGYDGSMQITVNA